MGVGFSTLDSMSRIESYTRAEWSDMVALLSFLPHYRDGAPALQGPAGLPIGDWIIDSLGIPPYSPQGGKEGGPPNDPICNNSIDQSVGTGYCLMPNALRTFLRNESSP